MSLFLKRGAPGGPPSGLYPPRILCFVCGAELPADYPLYPEPPPGGPTPFFPFLLEHEPPIGCRPPSPGGVAKSCRGCYSQLMRQWDEYEKGGISTDRRIYYVKRVDGLSFPPPETQFVAIRRAAKTRSPPHSHAHPGAAVMAAPVARIPPIVEVTVPPQQVVEPPLKSGSPLTVATTGTGPGSSGVVSPMATPIPHPHSSPSSTWSRRPNLPSGAASSAPSSLIQLSSERGDSSLVNVSDTDSGALDLSSGSRDRETMKSRSSVASHVSHHSSSYHSEGTSAASSASTNALSSGQTGSGSVTDIVDLTLPDKNATFEVCYVCGDEFKRGTLEYSFARQLYPGEPFYPSLMHHPRPPRSRPMDFAGRVQTCDECHEHLLAQWHSFESEEVPHADRNYTLRKRQVPAIDTTTFVCYICALDYHSSSLRLLYSRPNAESEPYYPFIEHQKPPPGASPISPQGMVQVCTLCYKSTKEKHHGFMKADQPPPKKRKNSHTFSLPRDPGDYSNPFSDHHHDEEEKLIPADVTCPLCRRKFSIGSFKFLHSQPPPVGGLPYFPFLTELPRPEDLADLDADDKQNRVRACQACTTNLINQWTTYQREQVPIEDRNYLYQSPIGPRSSGGGRPPTPSSIRSHRSGRSTGTHTPDKLQSSRPRSNSNQYGSGSVEAAIASKAAASIVPAISVSQNTTTTASAASKSDANKLSMAAAVAAAAASASRRDTHSPRVPPTTSGSTPGAAAGTLIAAPQPLSPSYSAHSEQEQQQATTTTTTTATAATTTASSKGQPQTANSSSFYCFLCGLHSELSFSRMLYSTAPGKKAPYFPFMKKHVPKNRAETLREDGTALVCTFCYHSVMVQWAKYNESKSSRAIEPNDRIYNLHDYRCYVCGITTYRKRIRALRVMDFPFLRLHKPRKGVITMENGEMVAVCLDCFESLRGQFIEAGKYGIPVEKRQYNWMQIPPPPEDGSSSLIITPQERLSKVDTTSLTKFSRPVSALALTSGSGSTTTTTTKPATASTSMPAPAHPPTASTEVKKSEAASPTTSTGSSKKHQAAGSAPAKAES